MIKIVLYFIIKILSVAVFDGVCVSIASNGHRRKDPVSIVGSRVYVSIEGHIPGFLCRAIGREWSRINAIAIIIGRQSDYTSSMVNRGVCAIVHTVGQKHTRTNVVQEEITPSTH